MIITILKKYKFHFTIAILTFISACLSAFYFGSIKANQIFTSSQATPILEKKFTTHSLFDSIKFSQYDVKFNTIIVGQEQAKAAFDNFIRDYNVFQIKNKDEIINVLSHRRP